MLTKCVNARTKKETRKDTKNKTKDKTKEDMKSREEEVKMEIEARAIRELREVIIKADEKYKLIFDALAESNELLKSMATSYFIFIDFYKQVQEIAPSNNRIATLDFDLEKIESQISKNHTFLSKPIPSPPPSHPSPTSLQTYKLIKENQHLRAQLKHLSTALKPP
mmetsp:Transcript_35405/g.40929  ORF Transcript_35405/g.40929 Transcript_35405/m.40929 type:complete len:166 (+) Transcript_35405:661-1158(+)